MLLPFSTVLGFTLYKDTGDGRAATHQRISSTIEVWYAPMAATALVAGLGTWRVEKGYRICIGYEDMRGGFCK